MDVSPHERSQDRAAHGAKNNVESGPQIKFGWLLRVCIENPSPGSSENPADSGADQDVVRHGMRGCIRTDLFSRARRDQGDFGQVKILVWIEARSLANPKRVLIESGRRGSSAGRLGSYWRGEKRQDEPSEK